MAIARVHVWSAGEVLLASDLNAEYNNILTNAADLVSPFTKAVSMGGFALNLDAANTIALTATTSGISLTGGTLREPTEDTLTAHAGGTQAAALALSVAKKYHRISVCATAGDSVALPTSSAGQAHFVRNDGAAAAQVFGTTPDTINGVATATGVPLPAASGTWYVCCTAGNWISVPVVAVAGGFPITLTAAASTNVTLPSSGTLAILGANTFTGAQTTNATSGFNESKTTVASAAAPDIWTSTGNIIDYTGSTTATSFAAAPQAGVRRLLVCAGAAPFTASANMLIQGIASASTFTAAAGDEVEVTAITTTQFRLVFYTANGIPSISTQTANTVFAGPASGAAAAPTFRTLVGADGTSTVLLQSQTASNAATVDFTIGISSTYDAYILVCSKVIPATDNTILWFRASTNGGSSYLSTNEYRDSRTIVDTAGTVTGGGNTGAAQFTVCGGLGTNTGEHFNGVYYFQNLADTVVYKGFHGTAQINDQSASHFSTNTAGTIVTTSAVNALRVMMSSGNINGKFDLYAIKKT